MRTFIFFMSLLLQVSICSSLSAQVLTSSEDENRSLASTLDVNAVNQTASNQISQLINNEVMITQIGNGNQSSLNISSDNASVNLVQRGDNNFTGISSFANQTTKNILQSGNDNTILNFGVFRTETQSLNFTQNGDGNTLIKYGENSIADKLKISVQGNDKTIIVRNFN